MSTGLWKTEKEAFRQEFLAEWGNTRLNGRGSAPIQSRAPSPGLPLENYNGRKALPPARVLAVGTSGAQSPAKTFDAARSRAAAINTLERP